MMDADRRRLANELLQATKKSHPQYADMVPPEFPPNVMVYIPEGTPNSPLGANARDPAFGVGNEGGGYVLVPEALNLESAEGRAKLGHELVHYLQYLNMRANERREDLPEAIAENEVYGPPEPPEVSAELLRRKFKGRRYGLEKDAQVFERVYLGKGRHSKPDPGY